MKLQCKWNDKMRFTAEADHHEIGLDAKTPIGSNTGMTPKELLLAGISGCTGMDVVSLLKKHGQPLESLVIEAESVSTEGSYPSVFKEVRLVFRLKGALDRVKVLESIMLSQTKYCGVSAMLSKAVPITYSVELNGEVIGTGHANFG